MHKRIVFFTFLSLSLLPQALLGQTGIYPLSREQIGKALGWVINEENFCGGYYVDQPFIYPVKLTNTNLLEITSKQGMLSQRGTSILENNVTINREGQQITANKAFIYRDPVSHKINVIELKGDVHFREPNTLIIAKNGEFNINDKSKRLNEIMYRTAIIDKQVAGPTTIPLASRQRARIVDTLSVWGNATKFSQTQPSVYELSMASFSTCPPTATAWQLKASHIVIDKNKGRGYATNARLLVRDIPVLYTPYLSFSIDRQRKSGFLWPTVGLGSNQWGPYLLLPFYWNMAPNYDMVITPGILTKRGIQISDYFRYLTTTSEGSMNVNVLPNDREFSKFKERSRGEFQNATNTITQAELNRLLNSSDTRKGFWWRDDSRFNEHWSTHVDFNYAGDDYYLRDLGNDLNEITENQLLQEGDLSFVNEHWMFTGRMQSYQTLHPLESTQFLNQYRRLPQLILDADYPNQAFGLEYFINNEVTHFEILKDPGVNTIKPVGNRLHTQPGVSLPISSPYFYFNPRAQLALTDYNLNQTASTDTPRNLRRAIPIFDLVSGLNLNRETMIFKHAFIHTFEPQFYYTYIPYRNQKSIPVFDTTVNTLTYDQIFNYNRFSGIDRIGDTHQVALGLTSRLIDGDSGFEKVRFGIGEIFYFAERKVTLCNDLSCSDNPTNHSNQQRVSPISALLNYFMHPAFSINANAIWDPITKQLNNSAVGFHYQPEAERIINLGFNYAREGDILSGIQTTDSRNNLKVSDVSFIWPAFDKTVKFLGRWSQNWNHAHLQNLLYGLQYDSCCWAIRIVGGRAFTGLDANTNRFTYHNQAYIQIALKGLGNVGTGNPSPLLRNITGYNPQFGQEL